MSQYQDESIAKIKRELVKKDHASIYGDGIYIGGQLIVFTPRVIQADVIITLPGDFIEMPKEIQQLKYPSESRPQSIFTSLDTTVNFSFNVVKQEIRLENLESFVDQLSEVIRRTNPSAVFYKDKIGKLSSGKPIYMFDFKTFSIDEPIYNMMCFTIVSNYVVHGAFSCMERDAEEWKDAAWEVFQSMRSDTEKEQA